MKKILLAMAAVAMLSSCGNSKNAVAYSIAQNYFVNNTFGNNRGLIRCLVQLQL